MAWSKWKKERRYPLETDWRGAQTNLVLRDMPFINYQILNPPKIITTWSNINTQTDRAKSGKRTNKIDVKWAKSKKIKKLVGVVY